MGKHLTKLGILGGTFDPVHKAHIVIAERVIETCRLDQVLFIPAANPPHKNDFAVTGFDHRYRMIELAVAGNPQFAASSIESLRSGKSFTEDTLSEMHILHPQAELYWIIGMDSACELHTWRNAHRLVQMAQFVVVGRPGWSLDRADPQLRDSLLAVDIPPMDISSTDIRSRVRDGRSIRDCVPEQVIAYIEEHNLYRQPGSEVSSVDSC